jgi:RNA polymerase sigma factor (sigma-70 family)
MQKSASIILMNKQSDLYYIERIIGGKTAEYAVIIDRYQHMVFNIARKIAGNTEDAEEIAQDVFVKAYQALASFKASSKFSTWLYRIAYNHAVSFMRKRQLDTQPIEDLGKFIYETHGEDDPLLEQMNDIPVEYTVKALEKLEKTDQIILTLYYKEEQAVKDIADVVGLSVSNIKVRLFRGRKRLMLELEKIFKNEMADLL